MDEKEERASQADAGSGVASELRLILSDWAGDEIIELGSVEGGSRKRQTPPTSAIAMAEPATRERVTAIAWLLNWNGRAMAAECK